MALAGSPTRNALRSSLRASGIDVGDLEREGSFSTVPAEPLAERLLDGGRLTRRDLPAPLASAFRRDASTRPVRLYGELVDLAWRRDLAATAGFEALLGKLTRGAGVRTLCRYSADPLDPDCYPAALRMICDRHTGVRGDDDVEAALAGAIRETFGRIGHPGPGVLSGGARRRRRGSAAEFLPLRVMESLPLLGRVILSLARDRYASGPPAAPHGPRPRRGSSRAGRPGGRARRDPRPWEGLEEIQALLERLAVEKMDAVAGLRKARRELEELLASALREHEAERARIAYELSEEVAQALVAVRIGAALTRAQEDGAMRTVDPLRRIDSAISTVRGSAERVGLRVLEQLGLASALGWRAAQFATRSGVRVRCEVDDLELERSTAVALVRILDEVLERLVLASGARNAAVALRRRGPVLLFELQHDGGGRPAGSRAGVPDGVKSRVVALGGRASLRSHGAGERLRVRIPLSPETA